MTTFKLGETIYKSNEAHTYFYKSTGGFDKKGNPLMMRIGKHVWEQAWDEFMAEDADAWDDVEEITNRKKMQEEKQIESDKMAEETINKKTTKKASKPRKSKDIALEVEGKTLTSKQVDFLKETAKTSFFEHGEENTLWCDVLADEIGGQFANKPMTVGAMISTLKEKEIITVGKERVNGHLAKYFAFTELGRKVVVELGLN